MKNTIRNTFFLLSFTFTSTYIFSQECKSLSLNHLEELRHLSEPNQTPQTTKTFTFIESHGFKRNNIHSNTYIAFGKCDIKNYYLPLHEVLWGGKFDVKYSTHDSLAFLNLKKEIEEKYSLLKDKNQSFQYVLAGSTQQQNLIGAYFKDKNIITIFQDLNNSSSAHPRWDFYFEKIDNK